MPNPSDYPANKTFGIALLPERAITSETIKRVEKVNKKAAKRLAKN